MNPTPAKPRTVDEYLAAQPDAARKFVSDLRDLSRAAVPDAQETLKWGHPGYVHPNGTILFQFSAHHTHVGFTFTPSTRERFDDSLADFQTDKGTVNLPYDEPIPNDLLKSMIASRVEEYEVDGVNWM